MFLVFLLILAKSSLKNSFAFAVGFTVRPARGILAAGAGAGAAAGVGAGAVVVASSSSFSSLSSAGKP